ncbi:cation efflux family-domain-containing protein [Chytridium lagenaria]|nr:cation efflux family-domain-containing protein [Chytridium lagenaria]
MWGSASLLADAVHSLLDLVSDFVTLFTFRKARSGRDALFPYGYGKLEPLGSLTISGILLFGGLGTGYHSLDLLRTLLLTTPPFPTDTLLLTTPSLLSVLAFAAIAASIAVKEILFWTTMKVAKRTGSDVLMANAWHHRADSVSSFVALVGVGGAVVGMPILDPVGGILVSGLIVQASLTMLFPALRELVDRAPQDILTKATAILTEVQQQERNIIAFNSVRGRKMGPDLFIDLQLQVNPRISVSQSHQISENVRYAILTKVPRVTEVLIHVDVEEVGLRCFFMLNDVFSMITPIPLFPRPSRPVKSSTTLPPLPCPNPTTKSRKSRISMFISLQVVLKSMRRLSL